VIDDEPLLILPLMHHLVQQRVQRFVPAIAPNVAAAQDDLRLAAFARRTVVTEAALHAARDANRHLAQHTVESLLVVGLVQPHQLANQRHVGRAGPLGRALLARKVGRASNWKLQNRPPGFVAHDTRAAVDEGDDRLPHVLAGGEEAVVDAQLATAVAHDDSTIRRQANAILRAEAKPL